MNNPNWPRWIFASASNWFANRLQSKGYKVFIEGQVRRTEEESDYLEFRLDGPYIQEPSKDYYKLEIQINILVVSFKNQNDMHKIYRMCGDVSSIFTAIPVYRYGDGPDDDQSFLECLTPVPSRSDKDAIRVTHFGQIDPSKQMLQSGVEGHYQIQLFGSN